MAILSSATISFAAGVFAGILNYAGLWITVSRLPVSARPSLLGPASFILRMCLVMALFYGTMNGSWLRLLVCVLGFLTVRFLVLGYVTGPHGNKMRSPVKGG